jgi:hypothetical protein
MTETNSMKDNFLDNFLSTLSTEEKEKFERERKERWDKIEKNRTNVDYWFPIVRWRTNYETEVKLTISHIEDRLKKKSKDSFRLKKDKTFYVKCPFCVRYYSSAWGNQFYKGNNKYGYPVSYQGSNCAASIDFNLKVKRFFIRCHYGSYLDGDILGFVNKSDEPAKLYKPESNNMCDYCIVRKLRQGVLKLVYISQAGFITNETGEFYPTQEEIDTMMNKTGEGKNPIRLISALTRDYR